MALKDTVCSCYTLYTVDMYDCKQRVCSSMELAAGQHNQLGSHGHQHVLHTLHSMDWRHQYTSSSSTNTSSMLG